MNDFLIGFSILTAYFLLCAGAALWLRRRASISDELFRKTLHFILLGSFYVLIAVFKVWQHAAAAALIFMAIVFPILAAFENRLNYSKWLMERKPGEIKSSLALVFTMFALLIGICWGWAGEKDLAAASVAAWGIGDAAAALIGKRYGRHPVKARLADRHKTHEGTLAMTAASFVSVLLLLTFTRSVSAALFAVSAVTAVAAAAAELFSR